MIMQLAMLGTGNVAQTLARRLSESGHQVTFGSRDPASRGAWTPRSCRRRTRSPGTRSSSTPRPEDTAGRYTLIDMLVPPGGGPPPHRHDFEEMFSVLEGEVELTFRGQRSVARAGETVNVPANAPHAFRNASDRPARLLCVCSPSGQEEFFLEVGQSVGSRTESPPELETRRERRSSPNPGRWPRGTARNFCRRPGAELSRRPEAFPCVLEWRCYRRENVSKG